MSRVKDVHLASVDMVSQDQSGRQNVLLLEVRPAQETDVGGENKEAQVSEQSPSTKGVINKAALETHLLSIVKSVQLAHQPVSALVLPGSAGGCSVRRRSTRETRARAVSALDAAVRV